MFCRVPHGEMMAKKWLDSIDKQKKKKQVEGQTDKQSQRQK